MLVFLSIFVLEIMAVSIRAHVHIVTLHIGNVRFSAVKDSVNIVKGLESRCFVEMWFHVLVPKFFVRIEHVQYTMDDTRTSTYQSILINRRVKMNGHIRA